MRLLCSLAALAALLAAPACTRGSGSGGVNDSTFVRTMSALEQVRKDSGLDSARRAGLRDSILQSHGLTAIALERAAKDLARDPDRARDLWQQIERRVNDPVAK